MQSVLFPIAQHPGRDAGRDDPSASTGLGLEAWAAPAASRPVFDEGRRRMALALADGRRATGVFAEIEVKEFLARDWNVSGRSVRPEHNMIGHTGFLVFMRKTATRPQP